MSASVQKSRFTAIGIHRQPAKVTKKDFDAKINALVDSLVALPVVQKNFLTLNLIFQNNQLDASLNSLAYPETQGCTMAIAELEIFQNNQLDASLNSLAYPETQGCTMAIAELESMDHFLEYIRDPAVRKILLEGEQFGFVSAASTCAVEGITRIEKSSLTERPLFVAIHKGPGITSPIQFQGNWSTTHDGCVALPVSQKNMLNHTVYLPNDGLTSEFQSLGIRAAEAAVIVMIQSETWDGMIEVRICLGYPDMKRVITRANKDGLFVDSNCFGADLVTKIRKI
ncbi:hypothetical protein B0H13DRAFT_1901217 [Mycena leptocephala]|nr:hypothetical protein B0H13DRAFT_1901217 [Mycena leptocephala]